MKKLTILSIITAIVIILFLLFCFSCHAQVQRDMLHDFSAVTHINAQNNDYVCEINRNGKYYKNWNWNYYIDDPSGIFGLSDSVLIISNKTGIANTTYTLYITLYNDTLYDICEVSVYCAASTESHYLDLDAVSDGSGAYISPWNSVSHLDATLTNNHYYFLKRGTSETYGQEINMIGTGLKIGAYGQGIRPLVNISAGTYLWNMNTASLSVTLRDIETNGGGTAQVYGNGNPYLIFDNCEFYSTGATGNYNILRFLDQDHLTIINCLIHNGADDAIYGLGIEDVEIAYNHIKNINMGNLNGDCLHMYPNTVGQDNGYYVHHNYMNHANSNNKHCMRLGTGSAIGKTMYNVTVEDNYLIGGGGTNNGISISYMDGVYIRRNYIYNTSRVVFQIVDTEGDYLKNCYIENNIIDVSAVSGIEFYENFLTNINVYNNTLINCGTAYTGSSPNTYQSFIRARLNGAINVYNNIFYTTYSPFQIFYNYTNISENYNCAYPNFGAFSENTKDIEYDPLFKNFSNKDYHINNTSPCYGAGVNVGILQDYEGKPIIAPPEIGAYEYFWYESNPVSMIRTNVSFTQRFLIPENSYNSDYVGNFQVFVDLDTVGAITYAIEQNYNNAFAVSSSGLITIADSTGLSCTVNTEAFILIRSNNGTTYYDIDTAKIQIIETSNCVYVDPGWSGTETGARATPYNNWRLDVTFAAGKGYFGRRGTKSVSDGYYNTLYCTTEATSTAPVWIGSYGVGAKYIIDGNRTTSGSGIRLDGSNIYLYDIEVKNHNVAGIYFHNTADSCRAINIYLHNNRVTSAFLIYDENKKYINHQLENVTVDSVYVHAIKLQTKHSSVQNIIVKRGALDGQSVGMNFSGDSYADPEANGSWGKHIFIANCGSTGGGRGLSISSDSTFVEYFKIYGCGYVGCYIGEGLSYVRLAHGYIKGTSTTSSGLRFETVGETCDLDNLYIFDVKINNCPAGYGISAWGQGININVNSCIISGCLRGINLTDGATPKDGDWIGVTIQSTLIYNNSAYGIYAEDVTNMLIVNCTFYNNANDMNFGNATTNIVMRNTIYQESTGVDIETYNYDYDVGNVFMNAAGGDFRLIRNSVCRNAGGDYGSWIDITGRRRRGLRDIGAYEILDNFNIVIE